jgi:hypothetical protein
MGRFRGSCSISGQALGPKQHYLDEVTGNAAAAHVGYLLAVSPAGFRRLFRKDCAIIV